jgi:hypothetical protein
MCRPVCRQLQSGQLKRLEVVSLRARRTITARKALAAELDKHGIPVADLLDHPHASNLFVKLLRRRAAAERLASEQAAALLPKPRERIAMNIERMRGVVCLERPSSAERAMRVTEKWRAADPLNLAQGALDRAARHRVCVSREKLRQLPPLRDIFAVCRCLKNICFACDT